ncbi:hypothetical protein KAF25_006527, partial [Fusarium avenaceum]
PTKRRPRVKTTVKQPVDDFISIGIDFGTTYSGIAWGYSREPEEIETVTNWEAQFSRCPDVEKAPTQLLYDGDDAISWGYSIPADKEALKWFKLLLLRDADITPEMLKSSQIREARDLLEETNCNAIDAVAHFLKKLWEHALEAIHRSVGPELLQKSRFHVVITIPAIWPPYAQQRMKQAAMNAGILEDRPCGKTTLRFITEPEAAALATIKDLSKRSTMKPGNTMVVCDAGGGTVDLISYVIESVNPFTVRECVKGDGGLCGGMFLDENFLKLIRRKVTSASWANVSKARERKFLNDEWERGIKPQFSNQQRTWLVDLPDSCIMSNQKLKRRKTLELSQGEILSVFTPIVDKIGALYIILVGGFGRSPYLYEKLQKSTGITVLQSQGSKPWTAICRGAVVEGLSGHDLSTNLGLRIDTRIARSSYGVSFKTEYARTRHRVRDKKWSEEEQTWEAHNQMKWFLREGNNMSTKKPVREEYYRLFDEDEDEDDDGIAQVSDTIYHCSAFPPPKAMGPTVEKLCEISWAQDVDLESLPTWTNPRGKVFRQLNYEIEMSCDDGIVGFSVYFEGNRVGSRHIEVNFK